MFKQTMIAGLVALAAGSASAAGVISSDNNRIELTPLGSYESGILDESAAEITAYDRRSKRLFVTNAYANSLDVLSIVNPRHPRKVTSIDLSTYGAGPNSVAVSRGIVAVAVEDDVKQDNGRVVFFNSRGQFLNQLEVGALPDMLTFTADGSTLLVANEGEPNDDYSVDPEGSVSLIAMKKRVDKMSQADVTEVVFTAFNDSELPAGIRIFGPNATVAQDLEPEYIATSEDGSKAYVVLQENNALAIIDIASASVESLVALGTKDHHVIQNAMDVSDRDDQINIAPWPVVGMYLPDAITAYQYQGSTYLITANEGDARDYDGYSEETRVKDLLLDTTAYPDAEYLQQNETLGRLKTTTATGDLDGDGDTDLIHAFGARSFSIWDDQGRIVYDSGSDFERILADVIPQQFNSTNDENGSFDNRSDDKGAEPEGVTVGRIGSQTYAFIGLERVGGIMVYNVTNPIAPQFVQYLNNRDFDASVESGLAKDLAPEGLLFIDAKQSPIRKPLLVVSNEVSGSTTVFKIERVQERRKSYGYR